MSTTHDTRLSALPPGVSAFEAGRRRLLSAGAATLALVLAGCASQRPPSGPTSVGRRSASHSLNPALDELALQAFALVGTPYRWGGNRPETGFDCSGLVGYVVQRALGLKLPRTTTEIGRVGAPVAAEDTDKGDLVFFNTSNHPYSHCGIYIGSQRFVHAPARGGTVRLEDISQAYWSQRYTETRRLLAT